MAGSLDIEILLRKYGPMSSGDLTEEYERISPQAARQRISRHRGIRRLAGIRLPHNERFVYLEEQYNKPAFWECLLDVLSRKHCLWCSDSGVDVARRTCL